MVVAITSARSRTAPTAAPRCRPARRALDAGASPGGGGWWRRARRCFRSHLLRDEIFGGAARPGRSRRCGGRVRPRMVTSGTARRRSASETIPSSREHGRGRRVARGCASRRRRHPVVQLPLVRRVAGTRAARPSLASCRTPGSVHGPDRRRCARASTRGRVHRRVGPSTDDPRRSARWAATLIRSGPGASVRPISAIGPVSPPALSRVR
jgi:hypothetical protein